MDCCAVDRCPGASELVHGGIVAYTIDAKHDVVGVDEHVLASTWAVSAQTAQAALAVRAQEVFRSTGRWPPPVWLTGYPGGKPVGTVFVAVDGPPAMAQLALSGDRHQIPYKSCAQALELLLSLME